MLNTVKCPKEFEPLFAKAQEYVGKYFSQSVQDPTKGTIEIFGQRYILVRAASMSIDFFEAVTNLYEDSGPENAGNAARSLLFDIAHAIGKMDARNFHKQMGLVDPIEKLSAGPVHFSHTGWAFVDIFPESRPTPDEDYYLVYDHPFSFESDAWIKAGKKAGFPVCVMNAGYSSGWCEESFGVTLVAQEIMCKAEGDEVCRFIMAHPSKIDGYVQEYLNENPQFIKGQPEYKIPGFFEKKVVEEKLREAMAELKRFNDLTVGRELRIIEMKKEVNACCADLGREPAYESVFDDAAEEAPIVPSNREVQPVRGDAETPESERGDRE